MEYKSTYKIKSLKDFDWKQENEANKKYAYRNIKGELYITNDVNDVKKDSKKISISIKTDDIYNLIEYK